MLLTVTLLGCQPKQAAIEGELRAHESEFSPLLESLRSYRSLNGLYPRSLSDLKNSGIPLITYRDQQGRAAYPFAITEVLCPPMKTPLKIASGVYQLAPEIVDWTLVQACDASS